VESEAVSQSKKDNLCKGQKNNVKRTNNDLQNTTHKTKDREILNQLKTEEEFLEIDSKVLPRTKHYDKSDDFNFLVVNFPFVYRCMSFVTVIFQHAGAPGMHLYTNGKFTTRKLKSSLLS
jgi:hypothetical protein